MQTCDYCNGTGLRGADGASTNHVGRLTTCEKCGGSGKVSVASPEVQTAEDIHIDVPKRSFLGAILQKILT